METLDKQQIETQCCVCSRIKTDRGWKRVSGSDFAYRSHAYCPRCYAKAMAQVQIDLHALNLQVAG